MLQNQLDCSVSHHQFGTAMTADADMNFRNNLLWGYTAYSYLCWDQNAITTSILSPVEKVQLKSIQAQIHRLGEEKRSISALEMDAGHVLSW